MNKTNNTQQEKNNEDKIIMIKSNIILNTNKTTKINYLKQIGLFKEDKLNEMNDKEINELIGVAIEVKGF